MQLFTLHSNIYSPLMRRFEYFHDISKYDVLIS